MTSRSEVFGYNPKLIIVRPSNLLLTLSPREPLSLSGRKGKGALWLRRKLHALEIICEIFYLISQNRG